MSQVMEARALASAARSGQCALRRAVAAGDVSIAQALADERSEGLKIGLLIRSVRGWGQEACDDLLGLGGMRINEHNAVRSLTPRQRQEIGRRVTPRRPK
jgi:hypothetical protein